MIFALVVYLFFLILYVTFMLIVARTDKPSIVAIESELFTVSIIIVARNESEHISSLFHSLATQNYPPHLIEVLFMDDNSTDQTHSLSMNHSQILPYNFTFFSGADLHLEGKKQCQNYLISQSKQDVLLFTDADVRVSPNWIESTMEHFNIKNVQMVCGAVSFYNTSTFFEKLMAIEFAALVQTSLGAILKGIPFMCNAANMALKKECFQALKIEGDSYKSGDDVFLLKSVLDTFGPQSITSNTKTMVYTQSPSTFVDFLNQRVRWAGKSSKVFFFNSFVVSSIVLLLSLSMIIFGLFSIIYSSFLFLTLIMAFKWFVDVYVLCQYQKNHPLISRWFFYSFGVLVLYPFYVVLIAFLSLKKSYLWKGRVVR